MIVEQLWQKFNDVKAVMWLVIKAHMIQINRYTFSNSNTDSSPYSKTISEEIPNI